MKLISVAIAAVLSGLGFTYPFAQPEQFMFLTEENDGWQPADYATQKRSPCPMLNTLANHGFLPRGTSTYKIDVPA